MTDRIGNRRGYPSLPLRGSREHLQHISCEICGFIHSCTGKRDRLREVAVVWSLSGKLTSEHMASPCNQGSVGSSFFGGGSEQMVIFFFSQRASAISLALCLGDCYVPKTPSTE